MKHYYLPSNAELVSQKEINLSYCTNMMSNSKNGFIDTLLLGAHKKYKADFFLNFDIIRDEKLFGKTCYQLTGTPAKMVKRKTRIE